MSKTRKSRASRTLNGDHGGLIPADQLFAPPGENIAIDPGPPLTPDEQFQERVAAVWAWVKAVRFHEHERLREVIAEIVEGESRGVIAAKECSHETP